MTTPKIPNWRIEPEEVWVNCLHVKELKRDEEIIVQFAANGKEYISFVPKQFVNLADRRLKALITADIDGGWLVDIPTETLTSGPRILVREDEKDTVLTFSGWNPTHGA